MPAPPISSCVKLDISVQFCWHTRTPQVCTICLWVKVFAHLIVGSCTASPSQSCSGALMNDKKNWFFGAGKGKKGQKALLDISSESENVLSSSM